MTNRTQTTSKLKAYLIGETIKSLRNKRHYSQEKLAELIDVDPKTIGRWERGDVDFGRVSVAVVYRIAECFEISLGDLLDGDPLLFSLNVKYVGI